jgi:hypothetical protein
LIEPRQVDKHISARGRAAFAAVDPARRLSFGSGAQSPSITPEGRLELQKLLMENMNYENYKSYS